MHAMRLVLLLAAAMSVAVPARAAMVAEPPTPDDYLTVLSNGPWPIEILAYCYGTVAQDPALQAVGQRWRQRNDGLLATVAAKAAAVDIPADVRRSADAASLSAIRRLVAGQADKAAWCRMIAGVIDSGAYDVDRRTDLGDALKRIFGKP
jgi:hypothetical protein